MLGYGVNIRIEAAMEAWRSGSVAFRGIENGRALESLELVALQAQKAPPGAVGDDGANNSDTGLRQARSCISADGSLRARATCDC